MNELFLQRMKTYLTDSEFQKYLQSLKMSPSIAIQVNKNFSLDNFTFPKISYEKYGYYLNDKNLMDGKHPFHHLGAIYFQEPSAMLPVNLYNFKGDEKVLDLCAAPGGKSLQIVQRIPNGLLVSNEINQKRSKILFSNLERFAISNAIVLNETPENLTNTFQGFFDVILLDSPCSGEGMLRKDHTIAEMWSLDNVYECANRDKLIFKCADKMLKKDGILIYSTCTFAKEENEDIIQYILDNYHYQLLEANEEIKKVTKPGFIDKTYRFYPFIALGEGQFMAILKKQDENSCLTKVIKKLKEEKEVKIINDFFKENLNDNYPKLNIIKKDNYFYALTSNIDLKKLNVLNYGIKLGEVIKNRFVPHHHFFKTFGPYFKNILHLDVNDNRLLHYLKGEEIQTEVLNGYGVIEINNLYLGGFKAKNNTLKNHYPKGLRNY